MVNDQMKPEDPRTATAFWSKLHTSPHPNRKQLKLRKVPTSYRRQAGRGPTKSVWAGKLLDSVARKEIHEICTQISESSKN